MRFSSVALVAGSALAHESAVSTDYTTQMVTVTACPPEVTSCPARSMTSSVITSVVPLTTSTVYSTKVYTVTSCGPEVTNCPAHSTVVSTTKVPVSTTVGPVGPSSTPAASSPSVSSLYGNSSALAPTASAPASGTPGYPGSSKPGAPGAPAGPGAPQPVCSGSTVSAVTKSYTTVLTSVEYSTIQLPCPTVPGQPQAPTGAVPGYSKGSSGTGSVPGVAPPLASGAPGPKGNGTQPGKPPVTAGAGSLAGSGALAAAAGLAAFFLA